MEQNNNSDDVMTAKHGATTEWMEANGECLNSIEVGDEVHVIDEFHASTNTNSVYKVVDVPNMDYSFNHHAIQIAEIGTMGPRITIAVGKVSKEAQR